MFSLEDAAHVGEVLTGIGTVVLAGATVFLVVGAIEQVKALKQQLKDSHDLQVLNERQRVIWETLHACNKYNSDPIVEEASKRMWNDAGGDGDYSKINKRDLIIVMNFFDGIAIALEQGMYERSIVTAQLKPVVIKLIDEVVKQSKFDMINYRAAADLRNSWRDSHDKVMSTNSPSHK